MANKTTSGMTLELVKLWQPKHQLTSWKPEKLQNGPSWGSDFCSKNGQKHWYLQCFVTKVGLKPLF